MILHTERTGSGLPVVLLHGLAGSTRIWDAQVSTLVAADCQVIALDLRGHGASDAASADCTVPGLAADVVDTLDEISVSRFGCVGHSLGGRIMWAISAAAADRVEFLVPVGAHSQAPVGVYRDVVEGWREVLVTEGLPGFTQAFIDADEVPRAAMRRDDFARRYWEVFGANRVTGLTDAIDAILTMPNLTGSLSAISCPVLGVVGAEDVHFLENLRTYERLISRCSVSVLDGCGHYPMIDAAAAFTTTLIDFIDTVRTER